MSYGELGTADGWKFWRCKHADVEEGGGGGEVRTLEVGCEVRDEKGWAAPHRTRTRAALARPAAQAARLCTVVHCVRYHIAYWFGY
eukprot:scaffold12020_cov122-Isochrysis_galbana.AAC.4